MENSFFALSFFHKCPFTHRRFVSAGNPNLNSDLRLLCLLQVMPFIIWHQSLLGFTDCSLLNHLPVLHKLKCSSTVMYRVTVDEHPLLLLEINYELTLLLMLALNYIILLQSLLHNLETPRHCNTQTPTAVLLII